MYDKPTNPKILVTGASGQLGHDVVEELKRRGLEYTAPTSEEMDITDQDSVSDWIGTACLQAVIHCAAYTAVDKAEDEAKLCKRVNAEGTGNIAQACHDVGAKMVYISTDYVFDGSGSEPWETGDKTGPLNVYGESKLAGEQMVRAILDEYFIVRISWVFGKNGNNFVKTMLRLGESRDVLNVVADQWGAPTYTKDLAPLLCDMMETEKYGTYHATNEGVTNWAEFTKEIFRQAHMDCMIHPISTAEYPTKAVRPLNSRLSKRSLDEQGFARLPDWKDALARYLGEV